MTMRPSRSILLGYGRCSTILSANSASSPSACIISCWLASLILINDRLTPECRRHRAARIHAPEKTPRPTAPKNDSTFIYRSFLFCLLAGNFSSAGLMELQNRLGIDDQELRLLQQHC